MKRFWAFIAACLFLLLTACGGSTSTTKPVWQAELPNTGITVQVSGCTLEERVRYFKGEDKNIRQMKNINKSVRSVSNGSRKVFCEVVKRANLFKATPHNSRLTA